MLSQNEFLRNFTDKERLDFNDELFIRDEDEIVTELMKVILSAQRDNPIFTILVDSFTLTEDYETIQNTLAEWKNRSQANKKKKDTNEYEFVNLKDSDVKLLTVHYYIKVKEDVRMLDVHILVPKIVNKYYFRIGGNMWLAMLQIVDGSTYNNTLASNPKKQNITFKVTSTPVKMFRHNVVFTNIDGTQFQCTHYVTNVFTKTVNTFKYILAKFGLYGAMQVSGIDCIWLTDSPVKQDDIYCVKIKEKIFINVPKYIYDRDTVVQSFFFTIFDAIYQIKRPTMQKIMTNDFWLESLGSDFKSPTVKKGIEILASLEGIYDIATKKDLRLDEDIKKNIYSILLWMMREFSSLRLKDNLDVTLKRVRFGQHIASNYAMKLVNGIRIITDSKNKVTVDKIIKSIRTKPTFLLDAICKSNLVNYRNLVNDLDSLLAVKYTYKGISGMGNSNSQSIATIYRHAHPSDLGIKDVDSSPKSDPGISGVLVPTLVLYDSYFSEYKEPNYWEENFKQTMREYKELVNKKEVLQYKRKVGMHVDGDDLTLIEENLKAMERLIKPVIYEKNDRRYERFTPILELGARIYFE